MHPIHSIHFEFFIPDHSRPLWLPSMESKASCGFPSPADDYFESFLSIDKKVIQHQASTFFVRATGDSMEDANIFRDDILVVDKAIEPKSFDICMCKLDGEFTVKTIEFQKDLVVLHPANKLYKPTRVASERDFQIWGAVTYILHKAQGKPHVRLGGLQ